MSSKPHLLHVDCLRGYAILMVLAVHTAQECDDLPWRFMQLFASGWHGVQLFFLTSTFTLLMSVDWEKERYGRVNWMNFFIRRYFRIAPAYYVAAVVYVSLDSQRWHSVWGGAAFALFLDSWLPFNFGQKLVLGGWSVGAEFSFYFVFPLIATYCHSIRRAAVLLVASIVLASVVNIVTERLLAESLSPVAMGHYIYYSFWNQLPIFTLANFVYHVAYRRVVGQDGASTVSPGFACRIGLAVALMALAAAAYLPLPRSFGSGAPWVPNFFFSAVCMAGICVVVAREWPTWLINPVVARLGRVSFSAYLWNWLVLDCLAKMPLGQWLFGQSRFAAMGGYFLALGVVVGTSWLLASASYRLIELPGMALGRSLIRRPAVPATAAA